MPPGFPPAPSQSAREAIDRQHIVINERYDRYVREYNRVYAQWCPIDNNSEHYQSYIHNMDNIFATNYQNASQLAEAAGLFVKSIWPSVQMPPPPGRSMEDVEDSKPPAVALANDTGEHDVYEVADF